MKEGESVDSWVGRYVIQVKMKTEVMERSRWGLPAPEEGRVAFGSLFSRLAPARSPRPHLLTLPGVRGQEASRAHLLQLELQCKRSKGVQACLVVLAVPGEERGQQPLRVARAPKHGSHVKAARSD